MRNRNQSIAFAFLFIFAVLFQNCSPTDFEGAFEKATVSENNGNGGHYDGKTSYVLSDSQNLCGDGSQIQAQIDKIENAYFLVRENCQDVVDRELDSTQVSLDLSGQFLKYAGQTFEKVRDPWMQPYSSKSLWNISVGSGAQWSGNSDPDTLDLHTPGSNIFAGEWSVPYFLGNSSSLSKTIQSDIADQYLPLPTNFHLSAPADGIKGFVLMDPTKRWLYQYSGCQPTATGYSCVSGLKDDACGEGLEGFDLGRGIIRKWEIESGEIKHALRFALPSSLLSPQGEAWPMKPGDFQGGKASASGNILYGSTVGIPANVNLNSLGLSRGGLILARALQNYGALQRDVSGTKGGINFFAEEDAEAMPQVSEMRGDLSKIVPLLRILRNQSATTPNGGGQPSKAPLPTLDPGICQ